MASHRRLARTAGLLAVAGTIVALGAPLGADAADHLDAPAAKADHRVDITDIYAYRQGGGTTLIMNVDGLLSPTDSKTAAFRSRYTLYEFKIDTNLDGKADIAYRVRFSGTRTTSTGSVVQDFAIRRATGAAARRNEWSGALVAIGKTTPYHSSITRVAPVLGGGRFFAGARDDPFFFDLAGFVNFKTELLMGSTDLPTLLGGFTGTDTFAGTNVLSIAINLPNARLGGTGRTVGVWATTSVHVNGGWKQIDRMGRPAINTVFNGLSLPLDAAANGAEKDAFNFSRPSLDRTTTKANVVAVLNAIGNVLTANGATAYSAAQVDAIANTLLPDELTLKLGSSAGFLNGRQPANDVIDAEFSLLTNGAVTSDGVNANDATFLTSFPTLARPH